MNWQKYLESVGDISISNINSYINALEMGIDDKLFFLDKINPDVIVDFGCADGRILSRIKKLKPEIQLIGYDIDETMTKMAKSRLGNEAKIFSNWNDILIELKKYNSPALLLSSVIHEVYSYSTTFGVKNFWERQVFGGKFKWICLRDMIPKYEIYKKQTKQFIGDVMRVRRKSDKYYLQSFEDRWGKISNNYKTFIHYLLKYQYVDNWSREIKENYVPITLETLYKKIPKNYIITLEENFILPSLQNQVKQDFGITITHTTHTKMIIEKK